MKTSYFLQEPTAQKEKGQLKDKSMTKEVTNTPETTQVTLLHSKKMWQT